MKKIRPIDNWRKAHKMRSVQIMLLIAVLNTAPLVWGAFLAEVPMKVWAIVNIVLVFAGLAARLVYQPKLYGNQ